MEGTLNYKSGTVSNSNWTGIEEINLCRDLGAVNRKAIHQTTSKGVPLVYHCKLTVYAAAGLSDDSNAVLVTKAITIPQNWVFRNAAVKLHAARNKMFKKNGITKKMLGRYASTIRYGWDGTSETGFLIPIDSNGDALWDESGSEKWDLSRIAISTDTDLKVLLCGLSHPDEESAVSATSFNLATAYLNSRKPIAFDDQTDSDTPAAFSIIRDMFLDYQAGTADDVLEIAEETQDHPPYDADDVDGPFTKCVEQGRIMVGQTTSMADSTMIDVPFGLLKLEARRFNFAADGENDLRIDVLGVSEMQG